MTIETYQIKLERPAGVTTEEMEEYILDAVNFTRGAFCPSNPLFEGFGDIEVKRMPTKSKGAAQ